MLNQVVGGYHEWRASRNTFSGVEAEQERRRIDANDPTAGSGALQQARGTAQGQRRTAARLERVAPGYAERRRSRIQDADPALVERDRAELREHAIEALKVGEEHRLKGEERPLSKVTQEFLNPNSERSGWEIFWSDPARIVADLGLRSLPQMAGGMVAGAVAGAAGGPVGFGLGMGAGSAREEVANTIVQEMRRRGVDMANPDSIAAFLTNDELMRDIQTRATKRAMVVGGVDGLSGMVGGAVLTPFRNTIARHSANVVAQLAAQSGMGAAGETLGQLAEGRDELAGREIAAEAAGEVIGTPLEMGGAMLSAREEDRRAPKPSDEIPGTTMPEDEPSPESLAAGPQEEVERFQFMRNPRDPNPAIQMEVLPLTQERFIKYVRPMLVQGYANTLEEFKAKNPDVSHLALTRRGADGEWKPAWWASPQGIIEKLRAHDQKVRQVKDFESPEAKEWAAIDETIGTRRDPNALDAKDSLLVAISKLGGLSREEAERHGIDPAEFGRRGAGIRQVFTEKGLKAEDLAERLSERGYQLQDGGTFSGQVLIDRLQDELAGQGKPLTNKGMEEELKRKEQERAAAEQRRPEPEEDFYEGMPEARGWEPVKITRGSEEEQLAPTDDELEAMGRDHLEAAGFSGASRAEAIRQGQQLFELGVYEPVEPAGVKVDESQGRETPQAVEEGRVGAPEPGAARPEVAEDARAPTSGERRAEPVAPVEQPAAVSEPAAPAAAEGDVARGRAAAPTEPTEPAAAPAARGASVEGDTSRQAVDPNAFKPGPEPNTRYRVTPRVSSTGGVMLEKRNDNVGSTSGFYVGVDGGLIDADAVAMNKAASRDRVWQPPTDAKRAAAADVLEQMGPLALNDPKRPGLKKRLKDIVLGDDDAKPSAPSAVDEIETAPSPEGAAAATGGAETFPVQGGERIPREVAERAYAAYQRDNPGEKQTLEQIAERGGFHAGELDTLVPGWREPAKADQPGSKPIKSDLAGTGWPTEKGQTVPLEAFGFKSLKDVRDRTSYGHTEDGLKAIKPKEHLGKLLINSGGMSRGQETLQVHLHSLVPLDDYPGDTDTYRERTDKWDKGLKLRGDLVGVRIPHGKTTWYVIDESFEATPEGIRIDDTPSFNPGIDYEWKAAEGEGAQQPIPKSLSAQVELYNATGVIGAELFADLDRAAKELREGKASENDEVAKLLARAVANGVLKRRIAQPSYALQNSTTAAVALVQFQREKYIDAMVANGSIEEPESRTGQPIVMTEFEYGVAFGNVGETMGSQLRKPSFGEFVAIRPVPQGIDLGGKYAFWGMTPDNPALQKYITRNEYKLRVGAQLVNDAMRKAKVEFIKDLRPEAVKRLRDKLNLTPHTFYDYVQAGAVQHARLVSEPSAERDRWREDGRMVLPAEEVGNPIVEPLKLDQEKIKPKKEGHSRRKLVAPWRAGQNAKESGAQQLFGEDEVGVAQANADAANKAERDRVAAEKAAKEGGGLDLSISTSYASGMGRDADFLAALLADVPFGVDVGLLTDERIEQVARAVVKGHKVFVDSGAFRLFRESNKAAKQSGQVEAFGQKLRALDDDALMQKYQRLSDQTVDAKDPENLALVMPDVIASAELTLKLLKKHRDRIVDFIASGHEVIVPVQSDPTLSPWQFAKEVVKAFGDTTSFRWGIPSNAAAMDDATLTSFIEWIQPVKVHILGAVSPGKLKPRLEAIKRGQKGDFEIDVSADGNVLRSSTDALAGLTKTQRSERLAEVLKAKIGEQQGITASEIGPKPAPVSGDLTRDEGKWTDVGTVYGDNGSPLDIRMRETRNARTGNITRELGLVDANRGSELATWIKHSTNVADLAEIETGIFQYTLTERSEEILGDTDPTDGDAVWAKFGKDILAEIRRKQGAPTQEDIDAAAHEAATSPQNALPQPTQAQKEANGEGNYKLGDPVKLHGVTWRVENPKGSYRFKLDERKLQGTVSTKGTFDDALRVGRLIDDLRSGRVPEAFQALRGLVAGAKGEYRKALDALSGESWANKMPAHYARAVDVEGADGDKLDAFIGPKAANQTLPVYVIDTMHLDGTGFDEHKVMIGFESADAARKAFMDSYDADVGSKIFGDITEMAPADFRNWVASDDVKRPASGNIKPRAKGNERTDTAPAQDGQPAGALPGGVPGSREEQAVSPPRRDGGEGGARGATEPPDAWLHGGRGLGSGAVGILETVGQGALDFAVDRRPERQVEPHVDGRSAEVKRAKERGSLASTNYVITEADAIGTGGAKTKARQNLDAIKIVKTLAAEKRPATAEEQATLVKYVGWGGMPQIFDPEKQDWAKEHAELKALLTADEYAAARRSTQDAHYTSETVVRAMWAAMERLGFIGGKLLEPSVGIGHFFGMMPQALAKRAQSSGVELDPLTAQIAQALYPKIRVAQQGFQDFGVPNGYYDGVIGNPPFGDQKLFDGERKHLNDFSIHNYFIAKAVDITRPGGVVAVVVSRYFMDSSHKAARSYIDKHAKLLGAIRLPNTAFKENANTEVVTDIVFLQKREEPVMGGAQWVTATRDSDGNHVNDYFLANPRMVLGKHATTGSMYRKNEYTVEPTGDLKEQLAGAIALLPQNVIPERAAEHNAELEQAVIEDVDPSAVEHVQVFGYFEKGGKVYQRVPDQAGSPRAETVEIEGASKDRMLQLIKVRDLVRKQLRLELADDPAMEANRKQLNAAYDKLVGKYGYAHSQGNKNLFADDPAYPLLLSLEVEYDRGISASTAKAQGVAARNPSAHKAAIFSRRVLIPHRTVEQVTSAADSLSSSLAERGRIDPTFMEKVYGKPFAQQMAELGDRVFEEPDGSGWETADEYLSGNVKAKLKAANLAAKRDGRYARNVAALTSVIPADLDPVDIDVTASSPWIPAPHMVAFAKHLFGESTSASIVYVPAMGKFSARIFPGDRVLATTKWGTERVYGGELLASILTNGSVAVYDTQRDGSRVLNQEATLAAQDKVEQIKREFEDWVWKDDKRRTELAKIYNDTFNTDVERVYDGSHLGRGPDGRQQPLHGASPEIQLRPHQLNYVWRFVQSGKALADHVVGAGKTFAAITAVMERKRLGLISKPMFVVPNHLTEQWGSDFTKLYPGAKVLVATKKDFEKGNRRKFFAKIATGEWDGVIIAHSSFERIAMPLDALKRFVDQQVADLTSSQEALNASGNKDRRSIKQMEKAKERLQAKLEARAEGKDKDDVVGLDELGVDSLVVDEAHAYKNLTYSTSRRNVSGLGNTEGSERAMDMFVKSQYILERNGGQNLMYLTGTPVSNSIAEMYHFQRYMDGDTLRARGLYHFDAWANTFASLFADWEVNTSGVGMKQITRFRKFQNFAELMKMYRSFADVVTQNDLKKMREAEGKPPLTPPVKGGGPLAVAVEASPMQRAYMQEIVKRAENIKNNKKDNMLLITTHARQAALDMRLRDPQAPDFPSSKVNEAARRVKAIYDEWHSKKGTQLVFIDLSTPKAFQGEDQRRIAEIIAKAEQFDPEAMEQMAQLTPDEIASASAVFDVYNALKAKLVEAGIPDREIEFIHQANTELRKEALFERVRQGVTRVLFGSTPKMGAGMNVQKRLVALHHLDAPWKPSDLEQREGRIIRQGNMFYDGDRDRNVAPIKDFAVEIVRYVTKGTYDARAWQVLENKARFIEQMRSASMTERRVEDIGGEAATAAAMKAAASDNPLIEEEIRLRGDIRKLEALKREHTRNEHHLQGIIKGAAKEEADTAERVALFDQDIAAVVPAGKDFTGVKVRDSSFSEKKKGGMAIAIELAQFIKSKKDSTGNVGRYRGFNFFFINDGGWQPALSLDGKAMNYTTYFEKDKELDPIGIITRLDNLLADIPEHKRMALEWGAKRRREVESARQEVGKPFTQQAELDAKTARQREILKLLSEKKKDEADQSKGLEPIFGPALRVVGQWWGIEAPGPDGAYVDVDEGPWTSLRDAQHFLKHQVGAKGARVYKLSPEQYKARGLEAASAARRERGLGVKVVEPFVRDIVNRWKGLPARVVVTTRNGLAGVPDNVKRGIAYLDPRGRMMGLNDSTRGVIYIFADNVPSLTEAERILVHEAKGHAGAHLYFGDEYEHYRELALKLFPAVAEEQARHTGADMRTTVGRNRVGDEIFAVLAEAVEAGTATAKMSEFLDRLYAAVLKFLRSIGVKWEPTRAEFRNMIRAAARAIETGSMAEGVKPSAFGTTPQAALADGPDLKEVWSSGLLNAVRALKTKTAPAADWPHIIKRLPKVKASEVEWSGVLDWLALQKGQVTREAVEEYLAKNGVRVEEDISGAGAVNAHERRMQDLIVQLDAEGFDVLFDPEDYFEAVRDRQSGEEYYFDRLKGHLINTNQPDDRIDRPEIFGLVRDLVDTQRDLGDLVTDGGEGGAVYEQYTLPGGTNYREVLLTTPGKPDVPTPTQHPNYPEEWALRRDDGTYVMNGRTGQPARWDNYDMARRYGQVVRDQNRAKQYYGPHWHQPNVVAHMRIKDRETLDGKRILFLEEVQSDWAQKGHKKGFGDVPEGYEVKEVTEHGVTAWVVNAPDGARLTAAPTREKALETFRREYPTRAGDRVPRGPFVEDTKAWASLVVKRVLRMAADGKYDGIAWTTGDQQVQRYKLEKYLDFVRFMDNNTHGAANASLRGPTRSGVLYAVDKNGTTVFNSHIEASELPDYLGEELAAKLLAQEPYQGRHGGFGVRIRDLSANENGGMRVGGAGMREFYDTIFPNVVRGVLNKLGGGGRVETLNLDELGGETVPSATHSSLQQGVMIPDALRERSSEAMDMFAALMDPDNEEELRRHRAEEHERRQRGFFERVLRDGQPLDETFALLMKPFGSLDDRRVFQTSPRLKVLARSAMDEAKKILAARPFRWMKGHVQRAHNAINARYNVDALAAEAIETAKRGLIDRYGQSEELRTRSLQVEADRRSMLLMGEDILKKLLEAGVESKQAEIMYRMMTVDGATDEERASLGEDIQKLEPEIREAIDHMGREYVELGLLSAETFEFWRHRYLPRSYLKYEQERGSMARYVGQVLDRRRKRIIGRQFQQRGIEITKSQERILKDAPDNWWGRRKEKGQSDSYLVGTHWHVLERVTAEGDLTIDMPGVDPKKIEERVTARVYWPTDVPIPQKFYGWANRGTFVVRAAERGNLALWRDWTQDERKRMTEIVDVRYALAKAFTQASNDIANGRYFRDIAANQNWASKTDPVGNSPEASERLWATQAGAEWVRVPSTMAPGTETPRYGALAGMYVRAEVWNDINQTVQMQKAGFWKAMMTQWKLNKTARNPVVHLNNIMSNFMLMDMIDVRARDLVRGVRSYKDEDAYYRSALEHGAFGADIVTQELKNTLLGPVMKEIEEETRALGGRKDLSLLGLVGIVTRAIRTFDGKMTELYRLEDEVFRMATYMREIERGATPAEAAAHAREQFLNYDIRAPWINTLRQTLIPFLAYTYRAVPVVAKSIYDRPWKLAKYYVMAQLFNALAYALMDDDDEDEQRATLRPEEQGYTWIGVERMLRAPFNDRFGNPIFWDVRRFIPAGDVFDMSQGSSALPVPAPAQFGGPLAMAFEFALNKKAFDGEPITDELTDTPGEKRAKVADWLWKSLAPSAPWVPGSWYWSKIEAAATGELDPLMREYSVPLAVSSSLGLKLRPHDVDLQRRYQLMDVERVERALAEQLRGLAIDLSRRRIDREFYDEEVASVQEKLRRLADRRRELAPSGGQ